MDQHNLDTATTHSPPTHNAPIPPPVLTRIKAPLSTRALLVLDFDGTITTHDTISQLANLALAQYADVPPTSFERESRIVVQNENGFPSASMENESASMLKMDDGKGSHAVESSRATRAAEWQACVDAYLHDLEAHELAYATSLFTEASSPAVESDIQLQNVDPQREKSTTTLAVVKDPRKRMSFASEVMYQRGLAGVERDSVRRIGECGVLGTRSMGDSAKRATSPGVKLERQDTIQNGNGDGASWDANRRIHGEQEEVELLDWYRDGRASIRHGTVQVRPGFARLIGALNGNAASHESNATSISAITASNDASEELLPGPCERVTPRKDAARQESLEQIRAIDLTTEQRQNVWGVVSVNWSREFIDGCIDEALGMNVDTSTTDLSMKRIEPRAGRERGLRLPTRANSINAVGDIVPGHRPTYRHDVQLGADCVICSEEGLIQTSEDKLRAFRATVQSISTSNLQGHTASDDGGQQSEAMGVTTVYIGDSLTDIECLAAADVGLCMVPRSGKSALKDAWERWGWDVKHVRGYRVDERMGQGGSEVVWVQGKRQRRKVNGDDSNGDGGNRGSWWYVHDFHDVVDSEVMRLLV